MNNSLNQGINIKMKKKNYYKINRKKKNYHLYWRNSK